MMSSAKDRQAKQRAKIKENSDLYKANLEKDRKRKSLKLAKAKAKMSNAEREEFLLKERMRMRKLRAAKKSAQHDAVGDSSNSMPYQSSQALGKAVKRARTNLPMSPRKQRCVVGKLAESVGLKVTANDSSPSTSTSSHGSALMTPKRVCMNSTTETFRGKLQGAKIESSFGRQQRMERESREQSRYDSC